MIPRDKSGLTQRVLRGRNDRQFGGCETVGSGGGVVVVGMGGGGVEGGGGQVSSEQ